MLTNVQPAPPAPTTTTITNPADILLRSSRPGSTSVPTRGGDGQWAASVLIDGEPHELVGFSKEVKSVQRGTLSAGKRVSIVDGRLAVEGSEPSDHSQHVGVPPARLSTRQILKPTGATTTVGDEVVPVLEVADEDPPATPGNVYIAPLLAACLFHLDDRLGPGSWEGTTPEQKRFLAQLPALRRVLNSLPEETIEAIGSTDASDVNAFLAERGFDIRLEAMPAPSLYVAAVLDMLAQWVSPAERCPLWLEDRESSVPGVKVRPSNFATSGSVLRMATAGDVDVYMAESTDLAAGQALIEGELVRGSFRVGGYEYAEFPMVEFDEPVDATSLLGLRKGDAVVEQVVARAKLRIDEVGVHARAAAAMAVSRGMSKSFKIGGPFTVAFVVDGGVAIAYHVGTEHFTVPVAREHPSPSRPRGGIDRSW